MVKIFFIPFSLYVTRTVKNERVPLIHGIYVAKDECAKRQLSHTVKYNRDKSTGGVKGISEKSENKTFLSGSPKLGRRNSEGAAV